MEGAVVGSPLYTSPEIVTGDGEPDFRSDIYSLGATAYYLLTGKPVFEGESALKVVFAHASQAVKPLTEINPIICKELEAIILKCLEKKPEDRYQKAEELSEALKELKIKEWTQEEAAVWWSDAEQFVQHEPDLEHASEDHLKATTILPVNV